MTKTININYLIFVILFLIILLLFTSCNLENSSQDTVSDINSAEQSNSNTRKPRIRMSASESLVYINQGDEYDLLDGVTGYDGNNNDITNKIQINTGGFDSGVAGEYMILYFLADDTGTAAESVSRTIIVKDNTIFKAPPVYSNPIDGEILNPSNPKLFGGAWYHKVVSSKDKWLGIEGIITLPEVKIRRYDGDYNTSLDFDPFVKNLDNPSVYMGGFASSESDVGLSFSRALIDIDSEKLSTGCIAFRPFWRYITSEYQDVGGYDVHGGEYAVSANGNNCIANYHWKYTEYYYLPGDKLRIIIFIPEPNKMQLQIEVIEKSTLKSSVDMRKQYGWKDPADFKSPIFHSPGHGTGIDSEYKRVNAIDQVANEGGVAHSSETEISNAIWHETYLYRKIDDTLYRVPMGEDRRGVLSAPDSSKFTTSFDGVDRETGGEIIDIHPGYSK